MLDARVKTFILVAESGSFSKAAKISLLSPVSVKKQMDSLESQVGVQLLERGNRGVSLTPAGKTFYDGVKRMEFLSRRTLENTLRASRKSSYVVRIGTSTVRSCNPLFDLWQTIGEDTSAFEFEIVSFRDNNASIAEVTSSFGKEIDCFLAPCDSNTWNDELSLFIYELQPLCLAFPRANPLSKKAILNWDDLDGESLIISEGPDFPITASIINEIRTNHPYIELVNYPKHFDARAFSFAAQRGCGIQAIPAWDHLYPSMVRVPVNWKYTMPYGLVYSKCPSPAMQAFINVLSRNVRRISWEEAHACLEE